MIFTSSRDLANNGVLRWMNGAYDHSNHYLSSSFFFLFRQQNKLLRLNTLHVWDWKAMPWQLYWDTHNCILGSNRDLLFLCATAKDKSKRARDWYGAWQNKTFQAHAATKLHTLCFLLSPLFTLGFLHSSFFMVLVGCITNKSKVVRDGKVFFCKSVCGI